MLVDLKVNELKLLEKNPRKITKSQLEKLSKSLEEDPEYLKKRPVLVNKIDNTYHVYAGNQRVRAAKKLKWKTIPCSIDENLDEKTKKKRTIKDNQSFGEFDYDILANEWDYDLLLESGMTESQISYEPLKIEPPEEDDKVLEPVKDDETEIKLGDIYELNQHRIICGDSTNPDTVSGLLLGETPILMVTDPPYGVNYDPNWRGKAGKGQRAAGKVQNDDKVNWSLAWTFFPGAVAYIWHAGKYCAEVEKSLLDSEYEIISQIIWVKQHFAISRGDYHWQHEPCWYACRKGHKHNWQGSRKEATIWEIANLNTLGKSKDDERTSHSTQKPIECMARPIRNNTAKGEGVYDPFMGSGTTLIASQMLERNCYGIEISPGYCDLIIDRWKNYMVKNNLKYEIKKNGEKINWQADQKQT